MTIKKIQIFDLDGTVICSFHRYRTTNCGTKIDLPYWKKNCTPEAIARDSLLPLANKYKKGLLDPACYVIIATARECKKGDANYAFVEKHLGMPDKFVHRLGRDDSRKGAELKIAAIKPLLNLKQFKNATVHIWEDNASYLLEMVNALGGTGNLVFSRQGH